MKPSPDATTDLIWRSVFILMSLLIAVSIPWDLITGPTNIMGRVLNLSIFPGLLFAVMLPNLMRQLPGRRERLSLLMAMVFILVGCIGHAFGMGDVLLPKLGLLAIFCGIVAGFGGYVLARDGADIGRTVVIWTLIGIVPIFSLPVILYVLPSEGWRYWFMNVPGFTNVRAVGHVCAIAVAVTPPLFMMAGITRSPLRTAALLLFTAAIWAVIFWSGSRAGVVALGAALPLALLLAGRFDVRSVALSITAFFSGAVASIFMPVPGSSFGIIARTMSKLPSELDKLDGGQASVAAVADAMASGRLDLWRWALARILEKPLFGWGYLPMYEWKEYGAPNFAHTHNIVLEYALGFGIPITLAVIVALLYLVVKAGLGLRRSYDPWRMCLLNIAVVLPVYSLLSGVLLSPYQIIYFTAAIGLLYGAALRLEAGPMIDSAAGEEETETVPRTEILATM